MGVVSNKWFDSVLLNSLHVQTLMLTDVRTPFLGTPLVPLLVVKAKTHVRYAAHLVSALRRPSLTACDDTWLLAECHISYHPWHLRRSIAACACLTSVRG